MLEAVEAGQTRRGVILQQVSNALDKPRRDGRFEEGIDIFRRNLATTEGVRSNQWRVDANSPFGRQILNYPWPFSSHRPIFHPRLTCLVRPSHRSHKDRRETE